MDEDSPAAQAIADARERTLPARRARIELFIDLTWEMPPMPQRRRGGLLRPLARLVKAAGGADAQGGDAQRRLSGTSAPSASSTSNDADT